MENTLHQSTILVLRRTLRQNIQLYRANVELQYRVSHDEETGLPNRFAFYDDLKRQWRRSIRLATKLKAPLYLSLAIIDLRGLKHYNDLQGLEAGDVAIQTVAGVLSTGARILDRFDKSYRLYRGDEFAVILEFTDRQEADTAIKRLLADIEATGYSGRAGIVTAEFLPDASRIEGEVLQATLDKFVYDAGEELSKQKELEKQGNT